MTLQFCRRQYGESMSDGNASRIPAAADFSASVRAAAPDHGRRGRKAGSATVARSSASTLSGNRDFAAPPRRNGNNSA
jgi:hypothetical protein